MHARLLLAIPLCLILAAARAAPERIALVIGNGGYRELKPLANPRNDAAAVAKHLTAMGFTLVGTDGGLTAGAVLDLDEAAFSKSVRAFAVRAKGAEIAFIYYAGHGMQIAGQPYLLPVDVPRDDLELLRRRSLTLNDILGRLDGKAALTVAVFDACREIPELDAAVAEATRDTGYGPGAFRGLARVQGGISRIVAYSGAAGQLVADGSGDHSPYSTVLLQYLDEPEPVERLLQRVAWQFAQRYGGQSPEILTTSFEPGRFYLRPPAAPPPPPVLGHLQVNVDTPAQIWLDGHAAGQAGPGQPLNLENISVEGHRVEVRATGREPVAEQVRVEAGRWTRVTFSPPSLAPAPEAAEAALRLSAEQRRLVQGWLNTLGHDVSTADGAIGARTRRAIMEYQRRAGLDATGYLNADLYQRLEKEAGAAMLVEGRQVQPSDGASPPESHLPVHLDDVYCTKMGAMSVRSKLDQPFYAEIDLLECVGGNGIPKNPVGLAPVEEFRKYGIERYRYLTGFRFQVVPKKLGGWAVRIETKEPQRDPYMNFLVEMTVPAGRLVREYTLLLDPPVSRNRGMAP